MIDLASAGPPPGVRPVTALSVVDIVIAEVRRSILDGSLPSGSVLSISELSDRLDVSHIPVREALRRLEGEGLITLRRGRSAVVRPLTQADLEELFHLRTLVESDLMARAVDHYDDAHIARIEAGFAALEIGPDDDAEAIAERHGAFHRLLLGPSLSGWDARLFEMLWQAGDRYMHLILGEVLGRTPEHFREAHRPLLDAARLRSADAAREQTAAHLDAGVELVGPALSGS